jgi:putative transposase
MLSPKGESMDEKHEYCLRRKAIRLLLKGIKPSVILNTVQRGRTWLAKWCKRFDQLGLAGLKSQSRRPHRRPTACTPRIVRLIEQTRRRLVKQKVGLIGPRAILRELRKLRLGRHLPSLTTIKRVLRARDLVHTGDDAPPAYFPAPRVVLSSTLHALDWTCRYLEGGPKVYAFHTLNLRTRACHQTVAGDKTSATAIRHLLDTWKILGIPHLLQLDNDAAFCGGYKAPRVFGQFVRLCLHVGVELVFLPVAEPDRNGEVEQVNGLWAHAFWERRRFRALWHVRHASPAFVRWYMTDYAPPYLNGLTPAQAQRAEPRRRLTVADITGLPTELPITAGHLHFIRKVCPQGTITLLNETWKVGQRWAGKYVWATVTTHRRRLDIWYQRSAQHDWQLLKALDYDIPERVVRLRPEFAQNRST